MTAGPPRSGFSPREHESLTVSTAAVTRSGVEEDIFPLGRVALRFVEQPQSFHEQALCIQRGRLLRGLAFEVDLEISIGPAENFEYGLIARNRAIGRMLDLATVKIQLTPVFAVSHRELATLSPHLERLNEVNDIHLRKAATKHAIR